MFNIQEYANPFHIHKKIFSIKNMLDEAIYKIVEDEADELFHSKIVCTNYDCRIGEYCFCEAIKVDLAESEDKRQKKSFPEKEESIFKHILKHCVFASHTI
jgi:hypothetical protein